MVGRSQSCHDLLYIGIKDITKGLWCIPRCGGVLCGYSKLTQAVSTVITASRQVSAVPIETSSDL